MIDFLSEESVYEAGIKPLMTALGKLETCTIEDIRDAARNWVSRFTEINQDKVFLKLCKKLESLVTISVTPSCYLSDGEVIEWLTEERKAAFRSGYWKRYSKTIDELQRVRSLDHDTNEILTLCGDPESPHPFEKKGLVIGDVQSGKTANFTGLLCKAVDAGYRIIIVVAGVLNSLRKQTQGRLEKDFIGDTSNKSLIKSFSKNLYGVSIYDDGEISRNIDVRTGCEYDFGNKDVTKLPPNFERGDVALFVIKKNVHTLGYVLNFFKNRLSATEKASLPVLLVDDEADNASINSKKSGQTPTAINARIRKILQLFSKTSYVGYTATPYANIFINPDVSGDPEAKENRMDMQDLFPKDFIYCLGRPDNYYGAARLFANNGKDDSEGPPDITARRMVQTIKEEDEFLKGLKNGYVNSLPDSLISAIYTFVLTKAIKNIRGDALSHTSMLVNVNLRKAGHRVTRALVEELLTDLNAALRYANLPRCENKNGVLNTLHTVWLNQFKDLGVNETWSDICNELGKDNFISQFQLIVQNSDAKEEELINYEKEPGQTLIVIGGNSLSRGLTLEHLTTSYFLRDSKQYDTLMQMGRWFGYRDGYEDLCRIFLTARMQTIFAAISNSTDELKDSIQEMQLWKMTPKDYGLKVRNSVSGLLVTAPNKMRSAVKRKEQLDFSAEFKETYILPSDAAFMENNRKAARAFLEMLDTRYEQVYRDTPPSMNWRAVATSEIVKFLKSCTGMRPSQQVNLDHVIQKISQWDTMDVTFVSQTPNKRARCISINGRDVYPFLRLPNSDTGSIMDFKKARFFDKIHEMGPITEEEMDWVKKRAAESKGWDLTKKDYRSVSISSIPGKHYRNLPGRKPLLVIGFAWVPDMKTISGQKRTDTADSIDAEKFTRLVAAYGISFPFDQNAEKKYVTWICNKVQIEASLREFDEEDALNEDDMYDNN